MLVVLVHHSTPPPYFLYSEFKKGLAKLSSLLYTSMLFPKTSRVEQKNLKKKKDKNGEEDKPMSVHQHAMFLCMMNRVMMALILYSLYHMMIEIAGMENMCKSETQ